jgi:hypothetical protein
MSIILISYVTFNICKKYIVRQAGEKKEYEVMTNLERRFSQKNTESDKVICFALCNGNLKVPLRR